MIETSPAQSLLKLDPDLGQLLSPERWQTAERDLLARIAALVPGPWHPDHLCASSNPTNIGLLVLSGVLARELYVHDGPSVELLGPGNIIRTWQAGTTPEMLATRTNWSALSRVSLALMDRESALALRRYPEVMSVVIDRFNARAERLAVTQAISQITGVQTRVETLLWHLAERWGRVGPDGVIIPLALSHRLIGSLIGARRPTVSIALARLAEAQRVSRRADGSWLLTGPRSRPVVRHDPDPFTPDETCAPAGIGAI